MPDETDNLFDGLDEIDDLRAYMDSLKAEVPVWLARVQEAFTAQAVVLHPELTEEQTKLPEHTIEMVRKLVELAGLEVSGEGPVCSQDYCELDFQHLHHQHGKITVKAPVEIWVLVGKILTGILGQLQTGGPMVIEAYEMKPPYGIFAHPESYTQGPDEDMPKIPLPDPLTQVTMLRDLFAALALLFLHGGVDTRLVAKDAS